MYIDSDSSVGLFKNYERVLRWVCLNTNPDAPEVRVSREELIQPNIDPVATYLVPSHKIKEIDLMNGRSSWGEFNVAVFSCRIVSASGPDGISSEVVREFSQAYASVVSISKQSENRNLTGECSRIQRPAYFDVCWGKLDRLRILESFF